MGNKILRTINHGDDTYTVEAVRHKHQWCKGFWWIGQSSYYRDESQRLGICPHLAQMGEYKGREITDDEIGQMVAKQHAKRAAERLGRAERAAAGKASYALMNAAPKMRDAIRMVLPDFRDMAPDLAKYLEESLDGLDDS